MTIICITDIHGGEEFLAADTLADAARQATEARVGTVSAIDVIPIGGTHSHVIRRDEDPQGFWLAQLAHTLSDNENFGWGADRAEAAANALPQAYTAERAMKPFAQSSAVHVEDLQCP